MRVVPLFILMVACNGDSGDDAERATVWSDDAQATASIVQDLRCTKSLEGVSCAEDGSPWLEVDGKRVDVETDLQWPPSGLYYSRLEGYVQYSIPIPNEISNTDGFAVVDAASGEELWRPDRRSVPSLNGALIASPLLERDPSLFRVTFHSARDGIVVAEGTVELPLDPTTLQNPFRLVQTKWVADDAFLVQLQNGAIYSFSPDGSVTPAEAPSNWFPSTSSSSWNAENGDAAGDEPNFAYN